MWCDDIRLWLVLQEKIVHLQGIGRSSGGKMWEVLKKPGNERRSQAMIIE